jgi:hypothetical protein
MERRQSIQDNLAARGGDTTVNPPACGRYVEQITTSSIETQTEITDQSRNCMAAFGESHLLAFNLPSHNDNSPAVPTEFQSQNPGVSNLNPLHTPQPSVNSQSHLVRTINDGISAHIPIHLKEKIWSGKYVNFASLLKSDFISSQGSQIVLTEEGYLETRPKGSGEKIKSIEEWTDAFLIFMDIYIMKNPLASSELLCYMSTIRQAASRRGDFAWRVYDEQFRMRQENHLSSWASLNGDLWLKVMTLPEGVRPRGIQSHTSTELNKSISTSAPACKMYNEGHCNYSPCRFKHVCSNCNDASHPKKTCPNFPGSQSKLPLFQGKQRDNKFR